MLPDLRFAIGAVLSGLLLIVSVFSLAATVRLAHQAKVGPFDQMRTLAYADATDWNQFYDADGKRRFDGMTRRTDLATAAIDSLLERGAPATAAPAPAPTPSFAAGEKPVETTEERVAAVSPIIDGAKDPQATIADLMVPSEPTPTPPLDISAAAVVEPAPSSTSAPPETTEVEPPKVEPSTVAKEAVAKEAVAKEPVAKDTESAASEPSAAVPARVAALPSAADAVEPKAAPSGDQAQKPTAQPKQAAPAKTKRRVVRRRAPVRTVQQWPTATPFPSTATGNQRADWLFNRN